MPDIFSLGDSALTIQAGDCLREDVHLKILRLQKHLLDHPLPGLRDLVIGYCSLTVYYDPFLLRQQREINRTVFDWLANYLRHCWQLLQQEQGSPVSSAIDAGTRLLEIPACFDADLGRDQVLWNDREPGSATSLLNDLLAQTFRVFMIGFIPGFPYMGQLDARWEMPRRQRPAQAPAGSIGIAGRQLGIYPFDSPAGWNIIGRAAIRIFDAEAETPVLLQPGDSVRFKALDRPAFDSLYAAQYG